MPCDKCQAELPKDAAFCPACGAAVLHDTEPPQGPASVLPSAPVVPPATEAAATADEEYARAQERYEQELAAYQWQQAAYQQQQYEQVQTPPASQVPAKKSKAGLIIGIIALVLFLLVGCGLVAVLGLRGVISRQPEIEVFPEDFGEGAGDGSYTASGYDTAEDALIARLSEDGTPDWVYEVIDEGDGYVNYVVGPPASEYVLEYFVEQDFDGLWSVTDVTELSYEDLGEDTDGQQAEAESVVWEFLISVYEDRGMDAQSFTTEPFSSDSASAQVSAGGMTDYNVVSTSAEPDGGYWVQTTQVWYGSTEQWEYRVVPTDAGYRISECRAW